MLKCLCTSKPVSIGTILYLTEGDEDGVVQVVKHCVSWAGRSPLSTWILHSHELNLEDDVLLDNSQDYG